MPLNNFLHSFGFICRLPRVGLSTTSCVYVVSISDFPLHPCASQQLPASIRFQYLCIPCLSATSCAHLVSIPYLPRMCLSSNFLNFRASISILPPSPQLLALILFPQFLACILFQYPKFPPPVPLSKFNSCIHAVSRSRRLPLNSPQLLACIVI